MSIDIQELAKELAPLFARPYLTYLVERHYHQDMWTPTGFDGHKETCFCVSDSTQPFPEGLGPFEVPAPLITVYLDRRFDRLVASVGVKGQSVATQSFGDPETLFQDICGFLESRGLKLKRPEPKTLKEVADHMETLRGQMVILQAAMARVEAATQS